ncbi:MAG: hypothetical protein WBN22_11250 [Verrucomicrobiia bacterium]
MTKEQLGVCNPMCEFISSAFIKNKGIYTQCYSDFLNWRLRCSRFSYGFLGCGGSDERTILSFDNAAFLACILTPLPSATALMMSVKLPFKGLCIFCGLLMRFFGLRFCTAMGHLLSRDLARRKIHPAFPRCGG